MWVEILTRSDHLLTDVKMHLTEHQGAMPESTPFGPSVTAASAAAFYDHGEGHIRCRQGLARF